ncbi:MAG: TIGR01777 family oxidoreductase, partial [Planctomycetota bacterium]|nr:TIGR01777 family oxidoreductase [Planctomycetota bacterium]
YVPGERFRDVQKPGPFAHWEHTHSMRDDGANASVLTDHIEYRLPAGPLGRLLGGRTARRKLTAAFTYRHAVTKADVEAHRGTTPARILVSGSGGLVGSALVPFLTTGGHSVVRLARDPLSFWDPALATMGADAVVHLAGESIAGGRWSAARKARIRDSRVDGTRKLAKAVARWQEKPSVLVCASAIGYYGDRGDTELGEDAKGGEGFLAETCRAWEKAAQPARDAGIRVVHLRFGIVLSPLGGALKKMLTPFKMGAGGPVGSGDQWMSWIAVDDVVGIVHRAIFDEALDGAVNAVAPEPVVQHNFAKTLGRVLRRPSFLPLPAFAARGAFGEMADELLLSSQRVAPDQLLRHGYPFRFRRLEDALRHLLGRPEF